MRSSPFLIAALSLTAHAVNVVVSNDDGWAEINIREFFYSLSRAGFDAFISAPADNKSGTGSRDEKPQTVGDNGCEFGSCEPGSPAYGTNESETRFNYVNSYPVTSMRYGIQNLSSTFFEGAQPDIAVAGFNVGSNLGIVTQISGTVGAAVEAVKLGIPAIAFSGRTGKQTAWNATVDPYVKLYAELATKVTSALTSSDKPYLPSYVFLNINFPFFSQQCAEVEDIQFVLSRIYPAIPAITPDDVETCGSERLPTERSVVSTPGGCYASISVGSVEKGDVGAEVQGVVLRKLKGLLSCLPESHSTDLQRPL